MRDWVDYATVAGAALTPLFVLLLTGVGWHIKNKIESTRNNDIRVQERIRDLEDKLRTDRIETYNKLLEPFFLLFTTDAVFESDPKYIGKDRTEYALSKMLTVEYRMVGFKLSLVADDAVVRTYNALMQFFYTGQHADSAQENVSKNTSKWIKLLSEMLLEIRRSMGNHETSLNNWEMIEWFLSDAHKMRELINAS